MNAAANSFSQLIRFRELIVLLVQRDLKVRYKHSALGMLWTLLNPLLQMAVYALVLATILRVDVKNYAVFVLSGLLPWIFISISATSSAHSLLGAQGLIRKIAVPQAVYPLSLVGSKLVDLLFSLVPLALLSLLMGGPVGPSWLFVPVAVFFATCFASGLSLIFATLTVFFRDLRHLIEVLFQLWFYLTPILFTAEQVEKVPYPIVRLIVGLNPATSIVRCFQIPVYEGRFPDPVTVAIAAGWSFAALLVGFAAFQRLEPRHIHYF